MRNIFVYISLSFSLISCNRSFIFYDVEGKQQKFTAEYLGQDHSIENKITPYRTQLEESMSELVVTASADLPKAKPSSPLGNLLADATKKMAATLLARNIDVGIMNYGGIRVPSISEGAVTLGNVYELMPFDNYLVVINLSGYQLTEVCHAIAAGGGWPVSGLKFKITNGLPYQIVINDTPLDFEQQYSVAISDYLANGGDHLDMLRGLPQINTNTLLRDAFLTYFRQIQDNGEALQLNNEMRISYE